MKKTILSYLKYSAAGLIASGADNLTYFLLDHSGASTAIAQFFGRFIPFLGAMDPTHSADIIGLIAARIVSLIVNFILLRFAVFQHGRRQDSFFRYILLVIFSTTCIYFLMQWAKALLPQVDAVFIKMGLEFAMNFFNYAVARFIVFDDKKAEGASENEA